MATIDWRRVTELFAQATALPREMHAEFLRNTCSDDPDLQREVLSLLEHDGAAPPEFLLTADGQPAGAARETAPPGPLVGAQIGKYQIRRVIAAGGMGTVFEAEQERPKRLVAIKLMHAGAWSSSARRRFEFECQALGRMTHTNIAQIYEARHWKPEGANQELPYFAMEYVPNAKTITDHAGEQKLGTRDRVRQFLQVCDAINYGHQRGIIHRDLKPANMLVDAAGKVKVIDFGVARATNTDVAATTMRTDVGELVGTLYYMSPEQCEGDPLAIDVRSDVYSLGVVLFQLLTDQLPYPFRGTSIYHTTRVIREETPTRPSAAVPALRGDIETILLKALEKEPGQRYQSVAELADDLQHYLQHEPILARRPSAFYQLRLFARRNRGLTVAIAASAAVLMVATGISTRFGLRELQARTQTEDREYATNLAAAEASIQRYDVADARRRLGIAAGLRLGKAPGNWECGYLSSILDQSVSGINTGSGRVHCISVSAVAGLIASSALGANRVQLWRVETVNGLPTILPTPVATVELPASDGVIESLDLTPDGSLLVVGTRESAIRVFGLSDPVEPLHLADIPSSLGSILVLAINNTGTLLAAGRDDSASVELWDLSSLKQPTLVAVRTDLSVQTLDFSQSGRYLAVGGSDHTIRLLHLEAARATRLAANFRGHAHKVTDVSFRADDKVLASSSLDGTVRLWDIQASIAERADRGDQASGASLGVLIGPQDGFMALEFSPDGRTIATGGLDNTVRLWDVDDHAVIRDQYDGRREWMVASRRQLAVLRGHEEQVRGLGFASHGEWVASGSYDGWLRVFATSEQHDAPTLIGHRSSVLGAVFDASGRWLISGSGDSAMAIWSVETGDVIRAFYAHENCIQSLSISDDRNLIVSTDREGGVRLWNLGGEPPAIEELSYLQGPRELIYAASLHTDRQRLAVGSQAGKIRVWSIEDLRNPSQLLDTSCDSSPVRAVAFLDTSGDLLAVGSGDEPTAGSQPTGLLAVWDLRTGEKVATVGQYGTAVHCIATDDNRTLLAAGLGDGTVEVWDISNPLAPRRNWERRQHTAYLRSVAFQPGGTRLASGSADRTARIWDVATGTELLVLREHPGEVTSVSFSPNGLTLATCSSGQFGKDNSIKLWEMSPDTLARRHDRWARSMAANTRREVQPMVERLFGDLSCKTRVLEELQRTELPDVELQRAALRLAESRILDLSDTWRNAWAASISPQASEDELNRVVTKSACALAEIPEGHYFSGFFLATRSLALYRLGLFEDAVGGLRRALAKFAVVGGGMASDLQNGLPYSMAATVLAMSLDRIGKAQEAKTLVQQVMDQLEKSQRPPFPEVAPLLEEAKALILGGVAANEPVDHRVE